MIIFIHGKEKFLVFERYLRLKETFSEKNPSAQRDEFDLSEEFSAKDIAGALGRGSGLFAEKKLIVFKDAFSLSVANQEALAGMLERSDAGKNEALVVLIVEAHSNAPRGNLLKFLKKNAKLEEQKPLKPIQLKDWMKREFGRNNESVSIEDRALEHLARLTGGNLWQIKNEIEKLGSYREEGAIGGKDIDLLCRGKTNAGIFDLIDAIGQGNKVRAFKLKSQLIGQGENEFFVFTMIVSQLRNLLKVADCNSRGIIGPEQISERSSMHPFVAQKSASQLRNFDKTRLKKAYGLAAEQDRACKQGRQNMEDALDYLIAKI